MKSDFGPTSEGYFQAVQAVAAWGLQTFGLKNFRLWCENSGGEAEYGGKEITQRVKEQVGYSSWIQSDNHVRHVLNFTHHKPFQASLHHSTSVLRVCAIQAMLDDVKDERTRLLVKHIPKYWKLRFVKAGRFVVYADFEEQDSEMDYKAIEPEIHEAKGRLEAQYTAAKLPVPEIVLVGFNADHQEIPE
jgi:hypothetical protein